MLLFGLNWIWKLVVLNFCMHRKSLPLKTHRYHTVNCGGTAHAFRYTEVLVDRNHSSVHCHRMTSSFQWVYKGTAQLSHVIFMHWRHVTHSDMKELHFKLQHLPQLHYLPGNQTRVSCWEFAKLALLPWRFRNFVWYISTVTFKILPPHKEYLYID